TNVLPRALGFPNNAIEAAKLCAAAIGARSTRRITVGRANGRLFSFGAGVGLDAELVRRVDLVRARGDGTAPGDLRFMFETVRFLAGVRAQLSASLTIDGFGRAAFALIANADPYSFTGRLPLHVAPDATFELGLDLVGMQRVRPHDLPMMMRALL